MQTTQELIAELTIELWSLEATPDWMTTSDTRKRIEQIKSQIKSLEMETG